MISKVLYSTHRYACRCWGIFAAKGAGQVVSLPHGHHIRPVEALTAWLDSAGITDGVLFKPVKLGGKIVTGPPTAHAASKSTAISITSVTSPPRRATEVCE